MNEKEETVPARRVVPPPPPRFPLFSKIVAGFVLIIVFMVFSSLFLLLQLRETFMSGKSELRQYDQRILLSQKLEWSFDGEREAARTYMTTRTSSDSLAFVVRKTDFLNIVDSLRPLSERPEIRSLFRTLVDCHEVFFGFIGHSSPQDDVPAELRKEQALGDSLRNSIHAFHEGCRFSLGKALSLFERRTSLAITGAVLILFLSLIVALAMAVMLARTVTKPIQALKAGTERVSEGHYETIAITSNDEVADLTGAFNLMSDKLKQLDQMRMQLMSEISHEMRTPLQVIKAGCYAISHTKEGSNLTHRQLDAVGMIQQATNRISSFVNSFLDIAKMEAGLMKFNFEPSDIVELMQPIVREAELIGQSRQIRVEFFTEKLDPLLLDRERMTQVMTNLFSNALKYTPDHGSVTVRVHRLDAFDGVGKNGRGCVRIDVQDSGVGIPKDDLEKLFSKFYQAKNTPLVKEKGSGLGLAIVKHVTEAHGGKVTVASEVGVGSTFTIVLPS